MKTRMKVSLSLYLLLVLALTVFGILYLLTPTVMPYHQQALGIPWHELSENVRILLWLSIKLVGAFFITITISMIFFLVLAFRKDERLALIAVFVTGLCINTALLGATLYLKHMTGASTPWALNIVTLAILFTAFILSLDSKKN